MKSPSTSKSHEEHMKEMLSASNADEYAFLYLLHDFKLLKAVRWGAIKEKEREFVQSSKLKNINLTKEAKLYFKTKLLEQEMDSIVSWLAQLESHNQPVDPTTTIEILEVEKYQSFIKDKLKILQGKLIPTDTLKDPILHNTSNRFKFSISAYSKTDLVRILNAMFEIHMFEKVDINGPELTKGEFMKSTGEFFGVDLTKHDRLLNQGLKGEIESNLGIFEKMIKKTKEKYNKVNKLEQ